MVAVVAERLTTMDHIQMVLVVAVLVHLLKRVELQLVVPVILL